VTSASVGSSKISSGVPDTTIRSVQIAGGRTAVTFPLRSDLTKTIHAGHRRIRDAAAHRLSDLT
jgi:hypothetical protein